MGLQLATQLHATAHGHRGPLQDRLLKAQSKWPWTEFWCAELRLAAQHLETPPSTCAASSDLRQRGSCFFIPPVPLPTTTPKPGMMLKLQHNGAASQKSHTKALGTITARHDPGEHAPAHPPGRNNREQQCSYAESMGLGATEQYFASLNPLCPLFTQVLWEGDNGDHPCRH